MNNYKKSLPVKEKNSKTPKKIQKILKNIQKYKIFLKKDPEKSEIPYE